MSFFFFTWKKTGVVWRGLLQQLQQQDATFNFNVLMVHVGRCISLVAVDFVFVAAVDAFCRSFDKACN